MRKLSWCIVVVALGCGDKPLPPDVIASHQPHPQAVVLADGYVYWTVYGTVSVNDQGGVRGTISRAKLDGGTVEVVHADQGHPRELAVAGTFLYWADHRNDTIVRAPLSGGASEIAWSDQDGIEDMVTAGDFVYWTRHKDGHPGRYDLVRARAPGAPEVVTEIPDLPSAIFVAPEAIYFTIFGEGQGSATGSVFRAEANGVPAPIATQQTGPNALAVVDGRVVWTNCGDSTLVAATTDGKPEILAQFPKGSCPCSIAVDGEDVFVATNMDGGVWHVAKGAKEPRLLGTSDLFAQGIAVDATHVYWANNGGDGSVLRARRAK